MLPVRRRTPWPASFSRRPSRAAALFLAGALGLALAPTSARGAEATTTDLDVAPISYVVAVDESGSLEGPDLDREKDAAGLAAIGELSPDSRVGVIGFGSGVDPKSPVDVACPLTQVSDPAVATCADKLRARTDAEGNSTDIPAAIRQGVGMLASTPSGLPRVLFVLTDGVMEVLPGEGYGDDAARIPDEMERNLATALTEAKAAGVQIWPLGFGDGVDRAQLDRIANGGAPGTCSTRPGDNPQARVIDDSSQVVDTLRKAFGTARCAGVTQTDSATVSGEADLKVTIPAIATDVVIQVQKADPNIEATFFDPEGRRVENEPGAVRRGQGSRIETLRVTDPLSGQWRIHLKAPAGVSAPVSAAALWQGVVRSYVQLNPPQPAAGESVRFSVILQTRKGNLTRPDALKGVSVAGHVEGPGIAADIPLETGANGEFFTEYKIPADTLGDLAFTGTVTAPGVADNRETRRVQLATGPQPASAALTLGDTTIEPGGTVTGDIDWKVNDGVPHTLRVIADFGSGIELRVSDAERQVQPGQGSFDFKLTFGDGVSEGTHDGRVTVVDAADEGRMLADYRTTVTVRPPPGFWDRYLWLVIGAIVLIASALALLVALARRRMRGRRIGAVVLHLYRDGAQVGVEAAPLDEQAPAMWFRLDTSTYPPHLVAAYRHEPGNTWIVRRLATTGSLDVETPLGTHLRLDPGRPVEIEPGLSLGFEDRRAGTGIGIGDTHGGTPGGGHDDPYGAGGGPYGGSTPYGASDATVTGPVSTDPYGTTRPHNPYGAGSGVPGPSVHGPEDNTFGYGPPRT